MPKIRGFKADLWTDEDFVELTPYARLLWMGMWNYACDNGHLADRSKQIKMRVLPTDDVNCAELLRELEENGRITRKDGVITIPNFAKHQKPDKRYFMTCDVPGCSRPEGNPERETRGAHHEARSGHTVGSQRPHVDGDGEVNRSDGDGDGESTPTGKPAGKRATRRPEDFRPSQAHIDLAAERGVNLRDEWDKFVDWTEANGKTYKDWPAALRNWIRNARPTVAPVANLQRRPDGRVELPPLPKGIFE